MLKSYSRSQSFFICIVIYLIAFAVAGVFIYCFFGQMNLLLLTFIADLIATVVVFAFSVVYKNSSLYDPYWSVVPPLLALLWIDRSELSLLPLILTLVIFFWAIRLTYNWARGWQGLKHEDWRYKMLHDKNPSLYWLTNFAGIHLFPTIMVFLGMLPVYYFMIEDSTVTYSTPLLYTGLAIVFLATCLELVADEQMRAFKKHAVAGQFITTGVWKYSRHPNYLGEIMFWFGLWIMVMGFNPGYWWTGIGFVSMLGMFVFASIPMMEKKNLQNKPGYQAYINSVSMLIPGLKGSSGK